MTNHYQAARAAALFRIFGGADRVPIVYALREQRMNPSSIAAIMGMPEWAASHHFCVLYYPLENEVGYLVEEWKLSMGNS